MRVRLDEWYGLEKLEAVIQIFRVGEDKFKIFWPQLEAQHQVGLDKFITQLCSLAVVNGQ